VQIKPAEADRFLSRPDPAIRIVLIYGADEGLVAERTATFVKAVTGASDDPFSHIRLEPSALSEDPGRLADEAHAIPMFGGRRAISIRMSGNWQIMPALEAIVAAPPADAWVVIAAGDLRKTSPIRRLAASTRLAPGSTAWMRRPRSTSISVSLPVPAPISRIRDSASRPPAAIAASTSSGG